MRDIPNNLFRVKSPLRGRVLENRRITPEARGVKNDVRHTLIASPGLRYIPGQSVGVIPPGVDPRTGKPESLRLYSVASAAKGDLGDGRTVSLCVVRHFWKDPATGEEHAGVCSEYLCDLKAGDEVLLTGPVGMHFLVPEDFRERDVVFFATGTGIAPFRGMLQELFERGHRREAWLVFGVPYRDVTLYDEEFRRHLEHPNFRYATAVSREETNPNPDRIPTPNQKMYVQALLYARRAELGPVLRRPRTLVYLCGLKGMEKGIFEAVELVGREQGEAGSLVERMKAERRLFVEVY